MRAEGDSGPEGPPGSSPRPGSPASPGPQHIFEPFHRLDGQLFVEELSLAELAKDLGGQSAWVLSRRALERVFAGPPGCLSVGLVGPLEVLAMAAAAGWWTTAVSAHELELAERAGFIPQHIAATVGWHDDGFVKDALTRGIASLPAVDEIDEQNIVRIARLLGLERTVEGSGTPGAGLGGLPSGVGLDAFAHCAGLLAPVLRASPVLVLDTLLDGCELGLHPGEALDVLPVDSPTETGGSAPELSMSGLLSRATVAPGASAPDARLHGEVARGDWAVIPGLGGLACLAPDPAHPRPQHVLVHGRLWHPLDPRPSPPASE